MPEVKGFRQSVLSAIWREFSDNRWLVYQLARRDICSICKQSLGGVFWIFFVPCLSILTLALMRRSGVLSAGNIPVPYALYAVAGLTFWQFFAFGLMAASAALVKAGDMLGRVRVSRKAFVLAAFGQPLLVFIFMFAASVIMSLMSGRMPGTGAIMALPAMVPLFFLSFGLGLVLALFNALVRDTGSVLSATVTFLLFLTPVLYEKPASGLLALAASFNPVYYLVSGGRDLLLYSRLGDPAGFFLSCLVSLAVLSAGLAVFHVSENKVIERI